MRTNIVRLSFFSLLIVTAPAAAQVEWTNHIDASMINDIVHKDGILYLATFGGLVLYDVDANRFEAIG